MTEEKKVYTDRGGPRDGSGRPAIYDERMVGKHVTLPENYAEDLRDYGNGNLSRGIRKAFEKLRELGKI